MRKLNCRLGELALVINSFDTANIGSIVRVLGRDAKACNKQVFWKIHAPHLLSYVKGEKQHRRKKGSLADADLNPIRGYPLGMDIAVWVTEDFDIKEGRLQVFEVDTAGTITSVLPEPRTNADAFRIGRYRTAEELIDTAQGCPPLEFAIEQAVLDYRTLLGDDRTAMGEADDGWCGWLATDANAHTWLTMFIDGWLEMSVDLGDSEFFQCPSQEDFAMQYFQRLEVETLDKLGVYLIEGEHPGSSFYAAVLREDMDYANQVAREKALGFRFKRLMAIR